VASFLPKSTDGAVDIKEYCSHLFQRVASFLPETRFNSKFDMISSHLFQRVASFLPLEMFKESLEAAGLFSSLSESGFIPTNTSATIRVFGTL